MENLDDKLKEQEEMSPSSHSHPIFQFYFMLIISSEK